jgi:hypothetical protein
LVAGQMRDQRIDFDKEKVERRNVKCSVACSLTS